MSYRILSVIFTIISLLGNDLLFAQPWMYNKSESILKSTIKKTSFAQKQAAFNKYWNKKDIEKGKGYKPFRRWEYFMDPRLSHSDGLNGIELWKAIGEQGIQSEDTVFWEFLGPGTTPFFISTELYAGNGRLNCIAFHPENEDVLYVGAPSGGIWMTNNGGLSWFTSTDTLDAIGISDIVISHANSDVIYAATGDGDGGDTYAIGIIKSIDGGITWNTTSLSLEAAENIYFRKLLIHPINADIMIATSSAGIYKTTDGWNTYSLIIPGDFKDIEFKPGDPLIVYATTFDNSGNAKIFISNTGGNTFSISSTGLNIDDKVERIELAVCPANPNVVYAVMSDAENSGFYALYKSSNSGDSWILTYDNSQKNLLGWNHDGSDFGGQGWYDLSLTVDPTNENIVFVGGVNLWKSTDGGNFWDLSGYWRYTTNFNYIHADHHLLTYSPLNNTLFSLNDGGIYKSIDNGDNWIDLSNDLQIMQAYRLGSSGLNSNLMIVGNQDNGTIIFNDEGWFQVMGGDGTSCFIDPMNDSIIYGSIYNGDLYKSVDKGINFSIINPAKNLEGAWITPFIVHPHTPSIIYSAYKDVYKSIDKGENWTKISTDLSVSPINSLAISPSNDSILFVATHNTIFKSQNAGSSWSNISGGLPVEKITSIIVSPNNPSNLWISYSGYNDTAKVFYSGNGGNSWRNYSNGIPNIPVNNLDIRYNSNNEIYAATDIGVYYRNANLNMWTNLSNNLPHVIVNQLEIIESLDKIRAATFGRGIWEANLPAPVLSDAAFSSDISKGCVNAPFKLFYLGEALFDSIKWIHNATEMLYESANSDTIILSYSSAGVKDIELNHYYNGHLTKEINYNMLSVGTTLDVDVYPQEIYICDTTTIQIDFPEGYSYYLEPELYIDSIINNFVYLFPKDEITYELNVIHGECKSKQKLKIIAMPDNVCNAKYLSLGLHGIFSNACATSEEDEAKPPIGTGANAGCLSQDGWCENEDTVSNSLWFKIVVPTSGQLRITCIGFDSQIALYKANNCNDLLINNYELIAANDDKSSMDNNSLIEVENSLTVGDTLYLQVDGSFGGVSGNFYLEIHNSSSTRNLKNDLSDNILLYPNPANNEFIIRLNDLENQKVTIELISKTGTIISSETINIPDSKFEIPYKAEDLNGFYILKINNQKASAYKKLIIHK